MAPFVGYQQKPERLMFKNSTVPNTFLDIEWTIESTDQIKPDQQASDIFDDEIVKDIDGSKLKELIS